MRWSGSKHAVAFFVGEGVDVYEGMIVGRANDDKDIALNVVRAKKLTNMRASGSDDSTKLSPPEEMSLERAIEFIEDDELVEITPKSIRIRKRMLNETDRLRNRKRGQSARVATDPDGMTMAGAFTLLAGLCALAALILIAMSFVFAQLIGWRALARRYGGVPGTGKRYASNGVLIGAHSWNAPPLIVAIDDFGITLLPKSPVPLCLRATAYFLAKRGKFRNALVRFL